MPATTSRVVLSSRETIQIHGFLASRKEDFLRQPRTYNDYQTMISAAFGVSPSEHTLRRLLKDVGLKATPRYDRERRSQNAKARIAKGGAFGPYGHLKPKTRKFTDQQATDIQAELRSYTSRGERIPWEQKAIQYNCSIPVLRRIELGRYLEPGAGSYKPEAVGTRRIRLERPPLNRSTTTAETSNGTSSSVVKANLDIIANKMNALIAGRDTDRTIVLRLVQENAVLAGLLRAVIAGISGLYTGLGVDEKHIPRNQEYQQTVTAGPVTQQS